MNSKTTLWAGIGLAVVTAILLGWNNFRLEKAQSAEAFLRLSPSASVNTGMTIPPDSLETIYLPESAGALASAAISDTPENREWLRDRRASRDVASGSILLYQFFSADPGSRFAATIAKGMRAVSIRVEQAGAVSYLIEPGSRVDVLGVFSEKTIPNSPKEAIEALQKDKISARTILQNVKVLAVGGATTRGAYVTQGEAMDVGTVTLELTPEQAELLLYSQEALEAHALWLSLRNPADTVVRETRSRTFEQATAPTTPSP